MPICLCGSVAMNTSSLTLFAPGDPDTVQSGFQQLSDVFSQFTKHITPAFNHDRPERSVQMRLYTMHKGQHLLTLIMFLCLVFIALLMGTAGPKIITEHLEKATQLSLNRSKAMPGGPFIFTTPLLSVYRQQLWIQATLNTKSEPGREAFTKDCDVLVQVEGLQGPVAAVTATAASIRTYSRSRRITCSESACDSFIVLHLGVLTFPRYLINITFSGLEIVDRHFNIEEIVFTIATYNPQFTKLEIWFRSFFVLTTSTVLILFVCSLANFPPVDWSIEQKWIALLLPAAVGFNNPAFAWCLLSNWRLPALLDAALQITFLFLLLLFWLCIFHGLRQTSRGLYTFYLPKLVLVGTMGFSALAVAFMEQSNELTDPSFSYQLNAAHYRAFQLYFMSMLALYFVYLAYLALRAFGELRSMNFLDSRLKFHCASMVIVLALTLSIVIGRYGSGVLEDNLVARIYTSYDSGGQFLALYTVLNCYVYILAYVYSPTSTQSKETHLLKDNPTFSMVNESDDDEEIDETEAMLQPRAGDSAPAHQHRGALLGSLAPNDDSD